MAIRYVVKKDVFLVGKDGRKRFFKAGKANRDGSIGYTAEELVGLTRDHLMFFEQIEMSGAGVVEQATQAPGEKRARKPKSSEEV